LQTPELDPYDHGFQWDPYPYYRALRAQDPVYFNRERGFWLLTKWDDVNQAFRDHKTFANAGAVALEADAVDKFPYPMFISMDPPDHSRIRRLFTPLMTPGRMQALEGYARNRTLDCIGPHLANGRIDFIGDLAALIPMDVLARLLRIPDADQDSVRGWADDLMAREDKQSDVSPRNQAGYMNLAQYFESHLAAQRELPDDGTLMGALVRAEREGLMTHAEVVGALILFAIAGNETTTKTMGNLAFRLWQHPEQRRWLIEDPARIPKAVEEVLRFDGSSQIIVRILTRDVELRGKRLRKGQRVGLCIVSAGRDEEKFPNAETFDVTRGSRDHMAFGHGIHACLGAALARLEMRIAFEEILRLMPDYDIDEPAMRLAHNPNVRGYTHLPATFPPR
jgi:cytochrome P450